MYPAYFIFPAMQLAANFSLLMTVNESCRITESIQVCISLTVFALLEIYGTG